MPPDFSFAICARVAEFPAMTLLQAAELRFERMELEDGMAVGLVLVAMVLDLAEFWRVEEAATPEADEVDAAVVGVILEEGVVEVERADVTATAEVDEIEAEVGVMLEEAAAGVLDVDANDTVACGAASAVAAKSRTR